jgi:hypothetical protein
MVRAFYAPMAFKWWVSLPAGIGERFPTIRLSRINGNSPRSKDSGLFAARKPDGIVWIMTYRGHIKDGKITLDEPARLPEGAEVSVEILQKTSQYNGVRITRPKNPQPLRPIKPIELPGGPLSDDIIRDRR